MAYAEQTSELQKIPGPVRQGLAFPYLNLKAQFASIRREVTEAIERVMESQQFILGSEVEAFEESMAEYVRTRFAVGCASGSDALLLSLLALGIGAGDEVITSPFTFVATAGAIARVGATPVFVDIQPETYNLDPALIRLAVNRRTRAILPVHLFGLPADLKPILEIAGEHNLAVIEDAAQAIGAQYQSEMAGSMGVCGCFSFFPSKNLGGAGDGGLITTNEPELAGRLRILRAHGSDRKYFYEMLGTNSRLDALQAAILRVKLAHLDGWTQERRRIAERYRLLFTKSGLLEIIRLPVAPRGHSHVYNQFVIGCPNRDRLRTFLRERGIPTEVYYPRPLHLQRAFAYLGHRPGNFPFAESACQTALALPIYPELGEENEAAVVAGIRDFYEKVD
jgi:dTDP-4-amino-4,6-dideoxygalactose transaminase